MSTHEQVSPLMQELSTYVAGALKRRLPPEVVERAKIHLVDTFAAMLSGSRLTPGRRAIAYIKPLGGTREAGVIGTRIVTTALNAVLVNGMCGHGDETDDVHPASRSHPGASVIPTVLAVAERDRLPGARMLRAVVLGYDICARTLLTLKPMDLMRSGHHAGTRGQLFGAAAAAAALLQLDARRVRYVLSYCAQQASGLFSLLRDTQHIEKSYASGGMPAHHGLAAALMVKSGFTGVEDVFSGSDNFISTYASDPDREALVRDLGREFEIMRAAIKRWSAGAPIQAPLQVLHDLMREHGFKADDVEKLVVRVPDRELRVIDNQQMADISLQHLLAIMLIDGTVTFAAAHNFARMKDPAILKLRSRIDAIGDPALTDSLRRWRSVVEVQLKDGRTLVDQTMAAKGAHENPLGREDVTEKAIDLMAPALGKQRARTLVATLFDIDRVRDVRTLRTLYAAR